MTAPPDRNETLEAAIEASSSVVEACTAYEAYGQWLRERAIGNDEREALEYEFTEVTFEDE